LVFDETFSTINEFDLHILIFDSASSDNTVATVKSLQLKYTHLHLQTESQKTGLGSAYHQAMNYALDVLDANIVVEFDADLSHQPKYLARMLELIKSYDVVVGSRYIEGGGIPDNWGWKRKALSKFGNILIQKILKMPYCDVTSGFRMIRRHALIKALPNQFISAQFAYKIELYWRLYQQGFKIIEFPIEFVDRTQGYSKLPRGSIVDSLRVVMKLADKKQ
jgi:dolichol-phosphate mannosyltransferase